VAERADAREERRRSGEGERCEEEVVEDARVPRPAREERLGLESSSSPEPASLMKSSGSSPESSLKKERRKEKRPCQLLDRALSNNKKMEGGRSHRREEDRMREERTLHSRCCS
jgi:hypothetical protein